MTKSTTTYWNVLSPENRERWTSIKGMEGMAEELTLSIDDVTGEHTRLTRFLPGPIQQHLAARLIPTLKRCSSLVVASTTKRLTYGLTPCITLVGPPENFTARSRPTSGVLCWKCRSPIGLVTTMPPNPAVAR